MSIWPVETLNLKMPLCVISVPVAFRIRVNVPPTITELPRVSMA